jgi:two-component sensor histidine kinase
LYSAGGQPQDRCFLVSTAPVRCNETVKTLVCLQDITDLKRTVHQLESALQEKTVLLKEVHHRVKNNLAVISSLFSMQADAGGPEARLALAESHRRVHSIALIHEHLYNHEHLDRVNFSEYARQLVGQLHSAFVADPERISLTIDAEPVEVGVDRAVPCALILNELLSNAIKHAFPAERKGEIHITFRQSAPGYLELAIEDNGVGFPPGGAQDPRSVGLSIVRILTVQLDGSLEQEACSGTRMVLRFPAGSPPRAIPAN